MFIIICLVAGAVILGILFHRDDEDVSLGVMLGLLLGGVTGLICSFIVSIVLYFSVPPVTTVETYKLEQHSDTSSYIYYVNVDNSEYSFSYFDNDNKIISKEDVENVSFTFEGKDGEVEVVDEKLNDVLRFFFFDFHSARYNITLPSKEYIRYE